FTHTPLTHGAHGVYVGSSSKRAGTLKTKHPEIPPTTRSGRITPRDQTMTLAGSRSILRSETRPLCRVRAEMTIGTLMSEVKGGRHDVRHNARATQAHTRIGSPHCVHMGGTTRR